MNFQNDKTANLIREILAKSGDKLAMQAFEDYLREYQKLWYINHELHEENRKQREEIEKLKPNQLSP